MNQTTTPAEVGCNEGLGGERAAPPVPVVPEKDHFSPDWSRIEALESSLREHQDMVRSLQASVAVQQWISVRERKPDDPQDCMFYSDDLRNPVPMLIGLYIRGKFKCAGHEMVNVTHWAPLPAAPGIKPLNALSGDTPAA